VGASTAPEWAPLELAERGLPGGALHGLPSGRLHVHLYLAPPRSAARAPACARGGLDGGPGGHPALAEDTHAPPEPGALANGHARGGEEAGGRPDEPAARGDGGPNGALPEGGQGAADPPAGAAAPPGKQGGPAPGAAPRPPAPPAPACRRAAPPGAPPGAQLLAAACLDLEALQALPRLAALDDAAPLPPNTLVLELSDGLAVHPRLRLGPAAAAARRGARGGGGEGAPADAPDPPVRPCPGALRPDAPAAACRAPLPFSSAGSVTRALPDGLPDGAARRRRASATACCRASCGGRCSRRTAPARSPPRAPAGAVPRPYDSASLLGTQ